MSPSFKPPSFQSLHSNQSQKPQQRFSKQDDGTTTVTISKTKSTALNFTSTMRKLFSKSSFRHLPLIVVIIAIISILLTESNNDTISGIPSKGKNDGYNLSKFLNVTTFVNATETSSREKLLSFPPESLAVKYSNLRRKCSVRPLRKHLKQLFIDSETRKYGSDDKYFKLAGRSDTLTIQLCIGHKFCGYGDYRYAIDLNNTNTFVSIDDDQSDDLFLRRVLKYIKLEKYKTALIVPSSGDSSTHLVKRTLKKLKGYSKQSKIRLVVRPAKLGWYSFDNRIYILQRAQNLIVHRGADAALVSLVSSAPNGILMSEAFRTFLTNDILRHNIDLHEDGIKLRATQRALNGMGQVYESCCKFTVFGKGDSSKVLCENAIQDVLVDTNSQQAIEDQNSKALQIAGKKCWILSLGCGGRWSFEEDIIEKTTCNIHVFDCTHDFQVPIHLKHRVKLDMLCVGPKRDPSKNVTTWNEIINIGSEAAGLPKGTKPVMAKVDVEGWEFPVFQSLAEDPLSIIPQQLVIEVHSSSKFDVGLPLELHFYKQDSYGTDAQGIMLLFRHLSRLGYSLIHRADNPYCRHCSEVTLLQKSAFPPMK